MGFSDNVKGGIVVGNGLFVVHFFARMVFYFFGFSFFYIIGIFALLANPKTKVPFSSGSMIIDSSLFILFVASPFIFTEYRIRKNRRKLGLPIYKNISLELLQMEVNKNTQMEYEANQHIKSIYGFEEKKDLNYWFELKEKGAITQEEYENKKQAFLNEK